MAGVDTSQHVGRVDLSTHVDVSCLRKKKNDLVCGFDTKQLELPFCARIIILTLESII